MVTMKVMHRNNDGNKNSTKLNLESYFISLFVDKTFRNSSLILTRVPFMFIKIFNGTYKLAK